MKSMIKIAMAAVILCCVSVDSSAQRRITDKGRNAQPAHIVDRQQPHAREVRAHEPVVAPVVRAERHPVRVVERPVVVVPEPVVVEEVVVVEEPVVEVSAPAASVDVNVGRVNVHLSL